MVSETSSAHNLVGSALGKYELTELLGSGGMAEVYRATQIGLRRSVAIKVMYPHLARSPGFKERFQREARILASLRHPNIIQIYDFDEDDGWYYMVMEYIAGGTLTDRLLALHNREQVMPPAEVRTLFKTIGSALDYAHQQGMVHRDIKPANIMFTHKNEPVLTDFGIARIVGATRFTQTGMTTGTPSYMSPEQGKGERGDERSDIYSLGVMLYETVTGRLPYEAETPFGMIMKHVNEPLPSARTLNPDLAPAVERVLEKAMAKIADERYQTAAAFTADLDQALAGTLIAERVTLSSPPPVTPPPIPKAEAGSLSAPATERRLSPAVLLRGGGIVILVLLVALGGFFVYRSRSQPEAEPQSSEVAFGPIDTSTATATQALQPTLTPTQPQPTATELPTLIPEPPSPEPPPAETAADDSSSQFGEQITLATDTATTPPPSATPIVETPVSPVLSGRIVYVSDRDGDFEIYLKDLDLGSDQPDTQLTNNNGIDDWFPDWASDGKQIIFTSNRSGNYDLYTMNPDGSNQQVEVTTEGWDEYGSWAPGSSQVVFATTAETDGVFNAELFRRNNDGSFTRLTTNQHEDRNPDWHPSGDIYYAANPDDNWDIFVLPADAGPGGQARNLTNHPAVDEDPALSPDYDRLVFIRKEADVNGDGIVGDGDTGNIYIMNLDGSGVHAVTSTNLDSSPAWSPDGNWIVYSRALAANSHTANLYATQLSDGTTLQLTDNNSANWGASWIR